MAVTPTTPPLSTLPPPPLPTDAEATFDAKAGASLTAQIQMVAEVNVALTWQAASMAATLDYKNAAALSATQAAESAATAVAQVSLAADQVGLAAQQVQLSVAAKDGAVSAKNDAQLYAAAAGSAAGLPATAGKSLQGLRVKADESGFELAPLGLAIGDLLITARAPDASYIRTGMTYLQSAYPELFSVVGLAPSNLPWIQRAIPDTKVWTGLAYGNGLFVTVAQGDAYAATSTDGVTWTLRNMSVGGTYNWNDIIFANGLFVCVAPGASIVATSPDGITWTRRDLPLLSSWSSISYGNGVFVVMNGSTIIVTSPDGIVWTQRTVPSGNWIDIVFGNGVFVAISNTSSALTSANGITWTPRSLPGPASFIGFGGGKFLIVATGSTYGAYSSDGISWVKTFLPSAGSWSSITYGSGMFLVGSTDTVSGNSAISMDGITWGLRPLPNGSSARFTSYNAGVFVAIRGGNASQALTMPFADYDVSTQFNVPLALNAVGYAGYIKARNL